MNKLLYLLLSTIALTASLSASNQNDPEFEEAIRSSLQQATDNEQIDRELEEAMRLSLLDEPQMGFNQVDLPTKYAYLQGEGDEDAVFQLALQLSLADSPIQEEKR